MVWNNPSVYKYCSHKNTLLLLYNFCGVIVCRIFNIIYGEYICSDLLFSSRNWLSIKTHVRNLNNIKETGRENDLMVGTIQELIWFIHIWTHYLYSCTSITVQNIAACPKCGKTLTTLNRAIKNECGGCARRHFALFFFIRTSLLFSVNIDTYVSWSVEGIKWVSV